MSYTHVYNEREEIERLRAEIVNITRRHCKIGKVRTKPVVAWPGLTGLSGVAAPARRDDGWVMINPVAVPKAELVDHPRNHTQRLGPVYYASSTTLRQ